MSVADLESDAFYQAVTAIDAGDVDGLQLLLAAHPRLVSVPFPQGINMAHNRLQDIVSKLK